jgi:hypothetical protein
MMSKCWKIEKEFSSYLQTFFLGQKFVCLLSQIFKISRFIESIFSVFFD